MKIHRLVISSSIYLFSILIYLVPISTNRALLTSPAPILDESHVLSSNNEDSNPSRIIIEPSSEDDTTTKETTISTTTLQHEIQAIIQIFQNDYWGRNMNASSSHKSYRPFTVLTFRYFKYLFNPLISSTDGTGGDDGISIGGDDDGDGDGAMLSNLFLQRVVNIILHSSIILMMHSFIPSMIPLPLNINNNNSNNRINHDYHSTMVYTITSITQLLFILHPSHCEIVINIANRGHLLSIIFGLLSCGCCCGYGYGYGHGHGGTSRKMSKRSLWKLGIIYCFGLLSSETFIFFLPIVVITWLWILVIHNGDDDDNDDKEEEDNDDVHRTPSNDHSTNRNTTRAKTATKTVQQKLQKSIYLLLPQIILITTLSILYLYIRHVNDWISIPNGLLRRAENPFVTILHDDNNNSNGTSSYVYRKIKYHVNYMYILSIHVIKSIGMGLFDIIGLSHEYGYNCISEINIQTMEKRLMINDEYWNIYYIDDERIWIMIGLFLFSIVLLTQFRTLFDNHHYCCNGNNCLGVLLWVVFCVWIFATLFPVSGFMKVGTFVADRLVVPSTVITSLCWGYFFSHWIVAPLVVSPLASPTSAPIQKPVSTPTSISPSSTSISTSTKTPSVHKTISIKKASFNKLAQCIYRTSILSMIIIFLSIKTYRRNTEWMTSKSLLESSLRTCPQNAKSNLEYSKIYSGLFYKKKIYDLNKALEYVTKAEEIDNEYCDVHYQFAYIYFQQDEYLKFEERIINGILCPFTMESSHVMFQQYWSIVLNEINSDRQYGGVDAKRRYQKHLKTIQDAIKEEERRERKKSESKSNDGPNLNSRTTMDREL